MMNLYTGIERFLRIDRFTTKSRLMRARAVYMMGLAFIVTQMINWGTMYYSYGSFTFDHLVSFVVCALVMITIASLRFSERFQVYAAIYSLLIVAATISSSLNQNTGINSALIPFFILGVIVNGFICGWRATTIFGAMSLVGIWFLWWVSSNYSYTPIFDVEKFADRNFQRAVQASLATILITMVGAFFSKNMHDAFGELEAGILAAQASDRAKTDFLAAMSHELRTPMNGIIGINEVLEETHLDAEQRELTSIISDSGRDLETIIGNVLLFSQLESGRVDIDNAPFDLRAVLKDSVAPFAKKAQKKGLVFKARIGRSVPEHLLGDEDRLRQILCALLDNAIKFTDAGAVELAVRGDVGQESRAQIFLDITDTGIGIPTEDKSRIFERFTQQDGSIQRRHGGTGLGLTIAQGLAELMGTTIQVQSELGVGSSFSVKLGFDVTQRQQGNLQIAAE